MILVDPIQLRTFYGSLPGLSEPLNPAVASSCATHASAGDRRAFGKVGTHGAVLEDTPHFLLLIIANHRLTQIFHSFEA